MSFHHPFKIIHLSDIHFGRIHAPALAGFRNYLDLHLNSVRLIIITGDLTQRARPREFLEAKEFLDSLRVPVFIVPGNHDIPLYHLPLRFFSPYQRFEKYLGQWKANWYEDNEIAVFGLRTSDNFTVKREKLHDHELRELNKRMSTAQGKYRIIAGHHPLTVSHLDEGFRKILKAKPHLLLWGHEHQSGLRIIPQHPDSFALAGGTAFSSRTRMEENSFNEISFHEDHVTCRTLLLHSHGEFVAKTADLPLSFL